MRAVISWAFAAPSDRLAKVYVRLRTVCGITTLTVLTESNGPWVKVRVNAVLRCGPPTASGAGPPRSARA
ncbi:hypothetical protein [Plantactinospora sp. DSM 117369]